LEAWPIARVVKTGANQRQTFFKNGRKTSGFGLILAPSEVLALQPIGMLQQMDCRMLG
jgi:hypothetical protein